MKLYLVCLASFLSFHIYAKTSAVIERWDTRLSLKKENDLVITEFLRVKILDEEGYYHGVFQNYYNSFRKIRKLNSAVYDASGRRVKKLGKSEAMDIMLNSSYETADTRLMVLDPKYRDFPFTVEIEVEIEYKSFLDLPQWMPRYTHGLEVREATLVIECYEDFMFRYKIFNGINAPVEVSLPGIKQITWQVKNLQAVTKQVSYKAFAASQPKVHLAPVNFSLDNKGGSFNTWKDFGDWYLELNTGRNALSDETKKHLTELLSKKLNAKELVMRAYNFMQRKTRYVSIQLGIGGFQAAPADEVERTGYGDCKALSNYMLAIFDYLEIKSNYVLVKAGRDVPDILSDFPSNQFNHVFVAVPLETDTVWLECTSQVAPASYIGTFTDDRHVLWVEKGGSKIIRSPVYTAEENKRFAQCNVVINDQGDASLSIINEQTGVYFDELLAYKSMRNDQIDKFNAKKFDYKDFTILSFDFEQPDPADPVAYLKYEIKANGVVKKVGDRMVFPVNMLSPLDLEFELNAIAKQSEIRRGFTLHDNVEIKIPAGYRIEMLPDAVVRSDDFCKVEIKVFSNKEGIINIQRKITMYKGSYEGADFDRFYESVKRIRSSDQARIVLHSKT